MNCYLKFNWQRGFKEEDHYFVIYLYITQGWCNCILPKGGDILTHVVQIVSEPCILSPFTHFMQVCPLKNGISAVCLFHMQKRPCGHFYTQIALITDVTFLYMPSFVESVTISGEEGFYMDFTIYSIGMPAFLVMRPELFIDTFVTPSYGRFMLLFAGEKTTNK